MNIKTWIHRITLGITLFLVTVLVTIVLIDGTFLSKTYLDPWDKSYALQFSDPRLQAVAYGLLAPNAHNQQSWKIRLSPVNPLEFHLFVDSDRLLPISDPYSRQITMSQGTFLETARTGAAKHGYKMNIKLFPDGEYDVQGSAASMTKHPIAKIRLEKTTPEDDSIFDAISRATSKTSLLSDSVTKEEIETLTSIETDTDLEIHVFNNKKAVGHLKTLTIDAMAIDLAHSAMDEAHLFRFTEWQKNQFRDGLTFEAFGFSGMQKIFMQSLGSIIPLSEESVLEIGLSGFKENVSSVPAYLMIISHSNSRDAQVRAGMLYSRLEHTAITLGLVMQPAEQALQEYPEMTELYTLAHKTYAKPGHTIQMLAGFGKPDKQVSHSPRRDILDLVED